jgi:adenine-specific DNA-methyltransferase
MASLFPDSTLKTCRLLDAGAGTGALSAAFLDRWDLKDGLAFQSVELEAYEIDATLRTHLETTLKKFAARLPLTFNVFSGDFISEAVSKNLAAIGYWPTVLLAAKTYGSVFYDKLTRSNDESLFA